jgi:hypothetical protein
MTKYPIVKWTSEDDTIRLVEVNEDCFKLERCFGATDALNNKLWNSAFIDRRESDGFNSYLTELLTSIRKNGI